MADASDDDDAREKKEQAERVVAPRVHYESFGWRFSGGLLATGHVTEALGRLTVVVNNALAFFGRKAALARTRARAKQRQPRTKDREEQE